jgi:hypothetical protein
MPWPIVYLLWRKRYPGAASSIFLLRADDRYLVKGLNRFAVHFDVACKADCEHFRKERTS